MNLFQEIAKTDRKAFQAVRRNLQNESKTFGDEFVRTPDKEIDKAKGIENAPALLFRNRHFLAALYVDDRDGKTFLRLTVNRTELLNDGNWRGDITWDELMAVKRGIGLGDEWMSEIYPADKEIVNVANMRHLFIVEQPAFAWAKKTDFIPDNSDRKTVFSRITKRFRRETKGGEA
jgi:hypothetical protein